MSYEINESCIGCTLCAKSCLVYAIEGEPKSKHSINKKRCVKCGVCCRICPANAIVDSNGQVCLKVSKKEWKKPYIDSSKCSACSLCVNICTLNCLEISKPQFKGDINVFVVATNIDKCVACEMCVNICPLNVIEMQEAKI